MKEKIQEYSLEKLISFIDNSNDENIRVMCVEILGNMSSNHPKIFETLENLLISDLNKHVREVAVRIIVKKYHDKGIEPIKWAIRNDSSLYLLSKIIDDLNDINEEALRSILIAKFKDLLNNRTKIEEIVYIKDYINNLRSIFKNKHVNKFRCQKLKEIFENFEATTHLARKYAISPAHFKYYLNDGLVTWLRLFAHNIRSIKEIKGLKKLTNLENLDLTLNRISEIEGFENFFNLKALRLGDFVHKTGNDIVDIKNLENLKNLELLDISFNSIAEIKNLDSLRNLKVLRLAGNNIKEIKGLNKLKKLEQLNLYNNEITEIKGLKKLTNLKQLYLGGNYIEEIKGLENLENLKILSLDYNKINEIKGLKNLRDLYLLNLSRNQISEIKGLYRLKNLSLLNLEKNQITKINNIDGLTSLDLLNIGFNPLKEIRCHSQLYKVIGINDITF